MAKIKVTNPKQIINGGAKKYYFKVKGVGGIKGDKGDKGDTGSQGPQGPQGNAATIEVGSTTTLPTGYDATVTNTGTINNAILNFGIPRGIKGDTGAKGDKGDKGDKGEQGNTGPQGPAGQNATVYVGTTTTGAPGTQASVYNSGTDRNAVLNFTIPQGATGATGATGPQGPAGQDGQNFTPTIVETLPTTGDQSKLYLTPKNYTTGTATGNPITISLGEDAGQITSAQLDGDTYQQTYTGKNLLNAPDAKVVGGGMTCTTVESNHFSCSGTVSESWGFNIVFTRTTISAIPAGNYVLSISKALAFPVSFQLRATSSGNSLIGTKTISAGSTSETFTLSEAANIFTFWSTASQNTQINDAFTVQIELGSTATSYEPYVGGVPSPNPEYPQQIQTVTGLQTVEVVGKNLFNPTATPWIQDVAYNASGQQHWGGYYGINEYQPVEASTQYAFSNNLDKPIHYGLAYYDSSKNLISTNLSDLTTFTTPASCAFIRFSIQSPTAPTWTQLEFGSTATTYAPYSKQTYEINLGKNLFSSRIVQGYYAFANGNYSPNSSSYVTSEDKIPVEAGQTYTISANKGVYGGSDYTGAGVVFFNNGTYVSSILRPENGTFTVPAGANQVIYNFYKGSSDSSIIPNDITWVQLELGSQATAYAPYFEPIELCKLGTYQDYIYKDGDDWKVHKAITTITVDGSEDWAYNGDNKFNAANISGMAMPINADALCYCATHIGVLSAQNGAEFAPLVADKPYATDVHKTLKTVRFKDIRFTTTTELQSWLSQNNTTIYYVVATATDTTITDQTLIAQLEAIRTASLQASNTITNTATGSNLAGDMELGYCEYDPTNRYDKWLWLDLNNAYEKIGS